MPDIHETNRARVAYAAYGQTTDFKNFRGDPMPAWDDLPEKIREAWVNASRAAACHHGPVTTYASDQVGPLGQDDGEGLRENINRLRAAAARLESGEVASFALAFVPETDAPFYSFRVSGMALPDVHRASGALHLGLLTVAGCVADLGNEARVLWRNGQR